MATFASEGNGLVVSGKLAEDEMDELTRQVGELLGKEPPRLLLDVRQIETESSTLVGVVAELGAEARKRSKTLIVRAEGRLADLLVWAGLHRVVTLYVSNAPTPVT
ncbi:MAG: STAS domain-containing protein [Planctomycetota bacterium]|jgi:anti-anti-sigma regulatory factor